MRFVRVPYCYLPTGQLAWMHRYTHVLLPIIWCIHNEEPHEYHRNKAARHYLYYPSFLVWVHDKSAEEMAKRGERDTPLKSEFRELLSRPLSNFIPPNDVEIAEDTVYLLDSWMRGKHSGGLPLPQSYVDLANQVHGYTPHQRALQRVADVPGHHRNNDAGWYQVQGQT